MSSSKPVPPAYQLLSIINPPPGSPAPTDSQADQALKDFLALLTSLENKHAKKPVSDEYLRGQVFGRTRTLKNNAERGAYCRSHLKTALREFRELIGEVSGGNAVTLAALMPYRDIVEDYIFDLAEIVPFLERANPNYVFLQGVKNAGVHSWQVYLLSRRLAYYSVNQGRPNVLEHKLAQIAAIFVLRQALELRFERLISVFPTDRRGKRPRLWHGFHQEFIIAHPQHFRCQGFRIEDIKPVYDWCSEVVHLAYQPFAWQIAWALKICGQLLGTQAVPSGQHWNIANAVEIIDVVRMQESFEEYFLRTYEHGSWQMTRTKPEALVKNWTDSMAFTSPNFHTIERPLRWRERLAHLWFRLCSWNR